MVKVLNLTFLTIIIIIMNIIIVFIINIIIIIITLIMTSVCILDMTLNCIWWYYLPTPPLGQDMTQGQFLSGV